jgi:gamma-glutamylputrescine oxidase
MNRRDFLKVGIGLGAGFAGAKLVNGSSDSKLLLENIIDTAYDSSSTNTYYKDTQNSKVELPQLTDDASCDVCIIGGGLTGISTAFRLANAGYKVILLEADKIANQASGMNGGQVLTAYECGMEYFEDKFGDDVARKLWQLSLEAVNIVKDNIRKYDIKCDWQSGTGITAFLDKHVADLEEEYEIMTKKYHYNHIRLLDKKETRDLIDSDLYYGCLYDDFAGHMHPLNYALGMTKVTLTNSNVNFYEKKSGNGYQI